jgi:endonuclease/exonuclease/phosphatase family metal-dependent hydrolase
MNKKKLAGIIAGSVIAIIAVIVVTNSRQPALIAQTYTLTTFVSPSGAGSVSPANGQYESGAQITLTATPASDYTFDYWEDMASSSWNTTALNTVAITMNANKAITAHFKVVESESEIRVAAFNIQIFGKAKREKEDVMDVLKEIAQEFDIMLVQEIRDAEEETASYYCQQINEAAGYHKYDFVESERLGRSSSKEAYAYFYNADRVQLIEGSNYVYNDIDDTFEREPYIASFRSGNFDFTLVGIHTKPGDANSEIGHLADVANSILAENPDEKDIIIMGDFNADGDYFDEDNDTNPFKSSGFHWVITNDMDTMTKTNWTYDRMVMMDSTFSYEYMESSAAVFYFDTEYGIDDEAFVWEVSDHYPIYACFNTSLTDDD